MPNLIHGQDPGGALRPIQVDDNGNLSIDLVSGLSVSATVDTITSITNTITTRQVSGSTDSTNVLELNGTTVATNEGVAGGGVLRVVLATDSAASVRAIANSGIDIGDVDVTSVVPGIAATSLGKAEDAVHASGDVGVAAFGVANEANTAFAADGDYVPQATDVEGNQRIVGNRDNDAVDAGEPVKVGGQARTTNPTAVADADRVNATFDDLGRQVITPYQVRDLISTASVTTTTGIETTLLAAVAGVFLDCVQVVCANTSDAVVDVDFRAVTAGSVEFSITVPADSTSGFIPTVPWPQGNTGNNWTMDVAGSDVSGTSVSVNAIFIRNI